ncbi:MAG: ATP-binding protein [Candidatus Helarchaeota archaeon]
MKSIYICPHYKYVDKRYFNQVFTKASAIRGEDEYLFYYTHHPIFLYDHKESLDNIPESDVLKELLREDRIGNFTVAIEGETGTGKSELCIYLAYELKKRGMPVLLIDKNSDLMSILANDIPNFYREMTGETIEGEQNLIELQRELKNNPKLLAHKIGINTISLLLKNHPGIKINPEDKCVKNFNSFLESQLEQLISREESYPSEIIFVTEKDIKEGDRSFDFGIQEDPKIIAEELNECIWNAIKENEKIPSIDIMLDKINNKISKRWAIIFEDFSISSLDKQRLKKFMERDKITDKINFIIAGLEDKLSTLHTPTAEDRRNERIIFYKTSKTGKNVVLFLDEDNCIEFIKPYITYFKIKDILIEFQKERRDVHNLIQLKINFGENNICNGCNKCTPEMKDLFPFNETFLKRIFKGLKENGVQKPRKFVEIVGSVLKEYFEFQNPPSNATSLTELPKFLNIPPIIHELKNEALNNFLRWYAEDLGENIKFSKKYAELLGIDYSGIKNYIENKDYIFFSKINNGKKRKEKKNIKKPNGWKAEWEIEYNKLEKYIVNWRENPYGSNLSKLNEYINNAIADIFNYFTNGYFIHNYSPFSIKIGKNEKIFTFNNQKFSNDEKFRQFQISINSQELTESEINDLLLYAINNYYNTKEYPRNILIQKIPYIIIEHLKEWQEKCYNYIYNFPYFKGKNNKDLGLIDIAFVYCIIAFIILYPWKIFSYKTFKIFLTEDKSIYKTPDYLKYIFEDKRDLKECFETFFNNLCFAKTLCLDFLKIPQSNVIDYILFEDYFKKKEYDVFRILKAIKKTSMNNFCKNRIFINFKDKNIKLEDFFDIIYTLKTYLEANREIFQVDFDRINKDIDFIFENISLNFKNLNEIYNKLRTFREIDRGLLANLNQLIEKKDLIRNKNNKGEASIFILGTKYLKELIQEYYSLPNHAEGQEFLKFKIFYTYLWVSKFEDILETINNIYNVIKVIPNQNITNLNRILNLRGYLD